MTFQSEDVFTFCFTIGVALSRPPQVDEYRKVILTAPNELEAWQTACLMASAGAVMPVSSVLEYVEF
jgi:hypothetical protein